MNEFHITIGTVPNSGISIDSEVRLLRTGVLYADRVTLLSPTASALGAFASLSRFSTFDAITFLDSFLQYVPITEDEKDKFRRVFKIYPELVRKRRKTTEEVVAKLRIEKAIKEALQKTHSHTLEVLKTSGFDAILPLVDSGLLKIEMIDFKDGTEKLAQDYYDMLVKSVLNGETYTLLDQSSSEMIAEGIREGRTIIPKIAEVRTKNPSLAQNLFSRLPTFDSVPLDELVGIRKELERELLKFRSALLKYAAEMRASRWDDDFMHEADILFHQEVVPAVAEIEEKVASTTYLRELTSSILTDPAMYGSPALSLLISPSSSMSLIVDAALGLGVGLSVHAYNSRKSWKKKLEEIRGNSMYFYYSARQRFL